MSSDIQELEFSNAKDKDPTVHLMTFLPILVKVCEWLKKDISTMYTNPDPNGRFESLEVIILIMPIVSLFSSF